MSYYNDEDDEDDNDRYRRNSRESNSSSLGADVATIDKGKGTISVFGKTFAVGKTGALIFSTIYEPFKLHVSEQGGKFFSKSGKIAAGIFTHNPEVIKTAGIITGGIWRYGFLAADSIVGVTTTIRDGIRDTKDATKLLSPYLAANHDKKANKTIFMSDDNPGVQNLRRAILTRGKAGLLKQFTTLVATAPSLLLTYWHQRQNELEHNGGGDVGTPTTNSLAHRVNEFKQSAEFKEWQRNNYGKDIDAYISTKPWKLLDLMKGVSRKDTMKGIFNPSLEEAKLNQSAFNKAPYGAGFIKQMLDEQFPNKTIDKDNLQQFAVVKIAKMAESFKKQPPKDHGELSEEIKSQFLQHFKDSGFKYDIKKVDKKLTTVSEELAKAIIDDDMNPYALIDLVCGNTIVKYQGGMLEFSAHHDRKDVIEKTSKKYLSNIDNQDFYKEVHAKPEDLKKIYDALSVEERKAFAMVVPVGVLEEQGVNKKELKALRRANRDEFMAHVSEFFDKLKDGSAKDLQSRYGMSEQAAMQLLSLAEDYNQAQESGKREADTYLSEHKSDVDIALVQAGTTAKKGKLWQELVGEKKSKKSEESEQDSAERDDDDDNPRSSLRASRRIPAKARSHQEYAERDDAERYV